MVYVTLLSSYDYLPAVLILNRNLKQLKSKYPLYVLVTIDIKNKVISYLVKENIPFIVVPVLKYSQITIEKFKDNTVLNTASKLNLFKLTQFDKIVYIDADSIFIKNFDEVFQFPDGAMYKETDQQGFSGMFVCCPKNHDYSLYMSLLENNLLFDGDLLGSLWFPCKSNNEYCIPFYYFINMTRRIVETGPIDEGQIIGIHFCNKPKPWECTSSDIYCKSYKNNSIIRNKISEFYFTQYLEPLKQDYPELF